LGYTSDIIIIITIPLLLLPHSDSISLWFFVHEISQEPQNRFAPNSHGRRVLSLARMSLKVKVKGQGQGH